MWSLQIECKRVSMSQLDLYSRCLDGTSLKLYRRSPPPLEILLNLDEILKT